MRQIQKCSDTERDTEKWVESAGGAQALGELSLDKALSSAPMRICHRDQRLLKGLPPLKRREERVSSVAWIPRDKACSQKTRFIYNQQDQQMCVLSHWRLLKTGPKVLF